MSDVTQILSAIEQGDPHAAEQLLPLVYDELRKLAEQKLAQEKPGQTLQATALVHEAYLRLVDVEKVRRKQRMRHGGELQQHATDGNEPANVYATGAEGNPAKRAFIAKYSADGAAVWTHVVSGATGTYAFGRGVAVDTAGNALVGGVYRGKIDFNPDPINTKFLTSIGRSPSLDAFVLKLNAAGAYVWAGSMGGPSDDSAVEVAVDGADNVLVSGGLGSGSNDFDSGAGTYSLTATLPDGNANYFTDAFVSKLVPSSTAIAAATAVRRSSPTVTGRHTRAVSLIMTIPSHVDARHDVAQTEAADQAIASLLGSATGRRFGLSAALDLNRDLLSDLALARPGR